MKLIPGLLLAGLLSAANPQLMNVKSVYILPMSNGMDQYLANQIQLGSIYTVVTDPQAADAVLTDAVGPAFERKMTDLYPPPKPEESEEETKDEIVKGSAVPNSSLRRGKGMVFLVERKSKQIVWSTYEVPKDARSQSLNKSAIRIADRLKKDVSGGK